MQCSWVLSAILAAAPVAPFAAPSFTTRTQSAFAHSTAPAPSSAPTRRAHHDYPSAMLHMRKSGGKQVGTVPQLTASRLLRKVSNSKPRTRAFDRTTANECAEEQHA